MRLLVNDDWENFSTSFYLEYERYERDGKRIIVGQENGFLIEQTLEPNIMASQSIKPLLKMPTRMAMKILCKVNLLQPKSILRI